VLEEAYPEAVPLVRPAIRPGMSATTNVLKRSHETTPRFGTSVVNG